jgi:hypothetical protein
MPGQHESPRIEITLKLHCSIFRAGHRWPIKKCGNAALTFPYIFATLLDFAITVVLARRSLPKSRAGAGAKHPPAISYIANMHYK